ncbi:MAG: asparagine synthase (glutamine-hydrolyzing) [Candidatus Aminicenantes bacterium RBG_16_63_16]|nr:MAG: asparagine synthase (glutamine-hydrolyzing) [Candidatus Aminicenantes bacterium RBG_16_63_16]
MCGICGLATAGPAAIPASLLEAMCRTLVHRGPDDQGIHVGRSAALGARRLSIVDVEGGHQPLSNEDGAIWAAHNGEVYNFPELRDELIAAGHRFTTRTDTETIVHSYEEWGEEFVHRLRGMFAFALSDEHKDAVLLVRDRLGIKPLYYTVLPNRTLVFGSELKAVLAEPRVTREIDPQALDLYLTLEYIPAPLTIFKNIHKLPAGSYLVYKRGRVEVRKYWDIYPCPDPPAGVRRKDLPGVMDEIYALLKESVKLRLVSDVPLGAFLSGGIDSSTIVGLMRELGASPLRTFSIGFEDESYNELKFARRIAERFETQHEELVIQPKALELTEKLVRHLDEPLGDFSIFPTYLVSEMARAHVKVALSGDGGDEVFGGYEHYQAQKIASRKPVEAWGPALSSVLNRLPPAAKKKGLWNKSQRFLTGLDEPRDSRHFRWMSFLSRRDKSALYTENFLSRLGGLREVFEADPFREIYEKLPAFDAQNGELYLDLKTYLADDIMVKVDRMSMAASLEAREPLLDHKLVELAFRLPGSVKLHGLTTKWIFKKTVERLLPRENIYRRKEGFSIPIKHWLRSELKPLLLDHLSEARVRDGGLFRYESIKGMIDSHLAGRKNYSHQLWALLVFEIWKENYL